MSQGGSAGDFGHPCRRLQTLTHAETIGYRVIDALCEHGLTITRKR